MAVKWIQEAQAYWNADKARIVGGAPKGVFDRRYGECKAGDLIPGEWWRVEQDGDVVGYGWLDINFGDGEILLAVDPARRAAGVGSFIIERLRDEAGKRGLNYVYNTVRPTHPEREQVTRWLMKRGFSGAEDGSLRAAARRKE